MQKFAEDAREQCDVLQKMFKKMESHYNDLAEYYAFDKQKYTLEEFFTDLKSFKDSFLVSKNVLLLEMYSNIVCLLFLASQNGQSERS